MKKFIFTILLSALALLPSVAQDPSTIVLPNDPAVRTGTLESGIKYYILANNKTPQRANFHIIYDVGSVQEEDRQDGLAHFLEHMAFNGSRNFPENSMIDYLQSIGVVFGENLNAGTGQQSTQYMITDVPITREGIVDSVLLILHDWAGFISLNEDDIDKERGVIQEEFRLYQGMASERVRREQMKLLFGQDNIYARRNMIGSIEGLQTFTYQDIRDFYHKWYRPDMQAFVIVGDFDVDQMEAKLRSAMSDIHPSAEKAQKEIVIVEDNLTPKIGIITDPELDETSIELCYRHEPLPREQNNTLLGKYNELVSQLATNMINTRLGNIALKPDAPFVSSYTQHIRYFKPFDMFTLTATARDGEAVTAFRAAYTELLRMKRHGFIPAELDRVKTEYTNAIQTWYSNSGDRKNGELTGYLINNFLDNTPYLSAEDTYKLNNAITDQITLQAVNEYAASLVRDKNIVLMLSAQSKEGVALPTEAELLEIMSEVETSQIDPYIEGAVAASLLDTRKLKGSKVAKTEQGKFGSTVWTLKNGIRVVIKPTDYKSDEIMMESTRLGGTSTIASTDDLYSINMIESYFSLAGLADFSRTDLQRMLAGKQASLEPIIDNISNGFKGSSSKRDLETMLQLMYLYATAPRFDKADWNTLVDKYSTSIQGSAKNPDKIFGDSINCTLYDNNPRNAPMSMEVLARTSLERMATTYKQLFGSMDGTTFVFTGSINVDEIRPLIEKYIGSLPVAKSKTAPMIGKYIDTFRKGIRANVFETPQEAGRVTIAILSTGTLNYSLAEKLNLTVAGQALNNIYTKTIREAKGGAYIVQNSMNVGSIPTPKFLNITFMMTDTSKLAQVLPEVQAGIDSIMNYGPSAEELTKSKEAMAKQFTENEQQNSTWIDYLTGWYVYGRDNYSDYLTEVNRITSQSVKEAAERAFLQYNRQIVQQLPSTAVKPAKKAE